MYLALDLDGTIGDFIGVWKILCALRQARFFVDNKEKIKKPPNPDFEWKIDIAYDRFVKAVALREETFSIGLFRPGIYSVFKEIVRLRKAGILKGVIIYSNNGSIVTLEFVRDVLETAFGCKIFDELVHFYHLLRVKVPVKTDIRKTWVELRRLLVEGACKAPSSIKPEQVIFIDDQIHSDLVKELGPNYVKIAPYVNNRAHVVEVFKGVLDELLTDRYFFEYVKPCFTGAYLSSIEPNAVLAPDFSVKVMLLGLKKMRGGKTRRSKVSKKRTFRISMKKY